MTYLWPDIKNNCKICIFRIFLNVRDDKHIFQCYTQGHFALFFNVSMNLIIPENFFLSMMGDYFRTSTVTSSKQLLKFIIKVYITFLRVYKQLKMFLGVSVSTSLSVNN